MATAGRKSGAIIQALRYLGQKQVDDQARATLRRQITKRDRPRLRKDLIYALAWIADLLRPLLEDLVTISIDRERSEARP